MAYLPRREKNDRCSIYVHSAGVINGIHGLIWKQYTNRNTNEIRYSLVDSSETWEWRHVLGDWRPVGTSQIEVGYSPASGWTEEVMERVTAPVMDCVPTKPAGTPDELKIIELTNQLKESNRRLDKLLEISEKLVLVAENQHILDRLRNDLNTVRV